MHMGKEPLGKSQVGESRPVESHRDMELSSLQFLFWCLQIFIKNTLTVLYAVISCVGFTILRSDGGVRMARRSGWRLWPARRRALPGSGSHPRVRGRQRRRDTAVRLPGPGPGPGGGSDAGGSFALRRLPPPGCLPGCRSGSQPGETGTAAACGAGPGSSTLC